MALPSPIPLSLLLLVASVVFGLAGLVWISPYTLPPATTWMTVPVLFTVILGATGIAGYYLQPGLEYQYAAFSTDDCSEEDGAYVYEYDELSSQDRAVFDSTIGQTGPYTTRSSTEFLPEDNFDAGQLNCVKKGSQYYQITVNKIGPYHSGEHGILYFGMMIVATPLLIFVALYPLMFRQGTTIQ